MPLLRQRLAAWLRRQADVLAPPTCTLPQSHPDNVVAITITMSPWLYGLFCTEAKAYYTKVTPEEHLLNLVKRDLTSRIIAAAK